MLIIRCVPAQQRAFCFAERLRHLDLEGASYELSQESEHDNNRELSKKKTRHVPDPIIQACKESRRNGLIDPALLRARIKQLEKYEQQRWQREYYWYSSRIFVDVFMLAENSIAHLCLSRVIHAALVRSGVKTIPELTRFVAEFHERRGQIWRADGIGIKRLQEIQLALDEFDRLRSGG